MPCENAEAGKAKRAAAAIANAYVRIDNLPMLIIMRENPEQPEWFPSAFRDEGTYLLRYEGLAGKTSAQAGRSGDERVHLAGFARPAEPKPAACLERCLKRATASPPAAGAADYDAKGTRFDTTTS